MSRARKPTTPWAPRLDKLMRAVGWSQTVAAQKLGFKCPGPVARLLKGGRPSMEVLRRLAALEELYAEQVKGYDAGLIGCSKRSAAQGRWSFLVPDEDDEPRATQQERGLADAAGETVAAVGASAAGNDGGHRATGRRASGSHANDGGLRRRAPAVVRLSEEGGDPRENYF